MKIKLLSRFTKINYVKYPNFIIPLTINIFFNLKIHTECILQQSISFTRGILIQELFLYLILLLMNEDDINYGADIDDIKMLI